ncbi:MAG: helix-turn-helix domain-containing protein [Alphaproteobacteria bacterium]|nr:helix-turn-helix domain-containing protein [Alphaproteobacteria bacterium]
MTQNKRHLKKKSKKPIKKTPREYIIYPTDKDSLVDHVIGGRIKSFRLASEMSQEKLAAVIGITFQQLQKYERGNNKISCNKLLKIAEELSVPVSKFFEDIDNSVPFKQDTAPVGIVSENIPTLIKESLSEQIKNNFPNVATVTQKETLELVAAFNKIKDKNKRYSILSLVKAMSAD